MTQHTDSDPAAYARFVAISAAVSGLVMGAAAGSSAVLAQSLWPLGFLVALLAFRAIIASRVYPRLARLRRWWTMPLAALAAGALFAMTPYAAAPFVLVAAVARFGLWFVVYAIFENRFDPRGEHGGGWL